MPNKAGQPVNMAPYKIVLKDGKYLVLNNAGDVKGSHPNRDAALAHLKALYAAVPGAGKTAGRKPWTGTQKRAVHEKAEEFFFEHTWQPVPGHPAEVATCAVCGLNRWSDDHVEQSKDFSADKRDRMAGSGKAMKDGSFPIENEQDLRNAIAAVGRASNPAAAKAHIKKRAAALGKTSLLPASWRQAAQLSDEQLARLRQHYSPQAAASSLGSSTSPLPGPDVDDDADTKAEEDAEIKASAGVPAAKESHPFMPAQYPDEAGHPRCRLCGLGTPAPVHSDFQPEQRVTAERTITLEAPGLAPVSFTYTGEDSGQALPPLPESAYAPGSTPLQVRERLAPVLTEAEQAPHGDDRVKAFVTEAHGKTLITAPASAFYNDRELALASNEHFLWMNGRFVGAEKANRNGALWTTDDLELGQVSVKHGPLNWLHEARHVIGTIADARLHTQNTAADQPLDQPYIEAASVIWKWIYPDEAWVVEQASDAQKLWYSMECVSKEVECAGQTGCGATASYGDYLSGKGGTCDHMRERSGTRRFANPTFLGGAVIVPPVRPGWAEADAQVMRTAASLAEKSFDQAGQPDVKASEWEQLMAQVLRFAAIK